MASSNADRVETVCAFLMDMHRALFYQYGR
jgi:hypothetical protein